MSSGGAYFGPALRLRDSSRVVNDLPASVAIEGLSDAVGALASLALDFEPTLAASYFEAASREVAEVVGSFGSVLPRPEVAGIGPIHSLSVVSERSIIAADVAASLSGTFAADPRALREIAPGAVITVGGRTLAVPERAKIQKLFVVASPNHLIASGSDPVFMSLDDLMWIHDTFDDGSDLYHFLRDLSELHSASHVFGFETMDAWELWRANGKSFHEAGQAPTGFVIAPHGTDAEWARSAEVAPLERMLHEFGLPSTWEVEVKPVDSIGFVVRVSGTDDFWALTNSAPPVAIWSINSSTPAEERAYVGNLGDGILWSLSRLDSSIRPRIPAHARLTLEHVDDSPGPSLRTLSVDPETKTIRIGYESRLWQEVVGQPEIIHRLLGEAISAGVGELADETPDATLRDAWNELPVAFSLDATSVTQRRTRLPKALDPHPAQRAAHRRDLAAHLRAGGLKPGRLEGDDAWQLESRVIYPYLLDRLRAAIASWDRDGLIRVAAQQLERAAHDRFSRQQQLRWNVEQMPVEFDPIERSVSDEDTGSRRMRRISFALEMALSAGADGTDIPDAIAWTDLVAVAELAAESGIRSDAIRYGIAPAAVVLSDLFEVSIVEAGDPPFDLLAYRRAMAAGGFRDRTEPATPSTEADFLTKFPEYRPIDQALRESYRFGVETLLGALKGLSAWPLSDDEEIADEDIAAVTAHLIEVGVAEGEVDGVLTFLTLRGEDLAGMTLEPWEFSKRPHRLVTKPIVAMPDGRRLVMPWWMEMSGRTYSQYLGDGRLPVPPQSLPASLQNALQQYRNDKNVELEDSVERALRDAGFTTMLRVDRPQRLGLERLYGEIDVVAVRPGGDTIWVIECKDSTEPYSPSELRRTWERFYAPDGWVERLERKVNDLAVAAPTVAARTGASETARVQGVMVTRHPSVAAYAHRPRVPFLTLAEIPAGLETHFDGVVEP